MLWKAVNDGRNMRTRVLSQLFRNYVPDSSNCDPMYWMKMQQKVDCTEG